MLLMQEYSSKYDYINFVIFFISFCSLYYVLYVKLISNLIDFKLY